MCSRCPREGFFRIEEPDFRSHELFEEWIGVHGCGRDHLVNGTLVGKEPVASLEEGLGGLLSNGAEIRASVDQSRILEVEREQFGRYCRPWPTLDLLLPLRGVPRERAVSTVPS